MQTLLAPQPRSDRMTCPAREAKLSPERMRRPSVLIVGRDRRERDDKLTRRLIGHFDDMGVEVLWDDPIWGAFERLETHLPGSRSWSKPNRRFLRLVLTLVWGLRDPVYLKDRLATRGLATFAREGMLRRRVARLQRDRSLFLLGRSAGGVLGTRLADDFRLSGVLCLGYPFQAPGKPVEAIRTAHLETLRTRTLIVQGETDIYGGRSVAAETSMSPMVGVRFFPVGHEFDAPEAVWKEIFATIDEFMHLT